MRTLKEDHKLIGAVEAARQIAELRGLADQVARYDGQLANWRQRIELSTRAYTSTLFQVAEDYPPARRRAQHDVLIADLQSSGQEGLARYVTRFTEELTRYTLDPSLETGAVDRAGDQRLMGTVKMTCGARIWRAMTDDTVPFAATDRACARGADRPCRLRGRWLAARHVWLRRCRS